jgi:hypothetical protein
MLKSFHINLAMECSRPAEAADGTSQAGTAIAAEAEEEQKTSTADGSEQAAKKRKTNGGESVSLRSTADDSSQFTRVGVYRCMWRALKFLEDACSSRAREDVRYCRNGVNMITHDLEQEQITSLLNIVRSIRGDMDESFVAAFS